MEVLREDAELLAEDELPLLAGFPVPLAVPVRPADEERLPPRDAVLDEVVLFPVFAAMNEFYASSKINPADAPRISEVKIVFL